MLLTVTSLHFNTPLFFNPTIAIIKLFRVCAALQCNQMFVKRTSADPREKLTHALLYLTAYSLPLLKKFTAQSNKVST